MPSSYKITSKLEPLVYSNSSGGNTSPSNTLAVTRATRKGGMPPGEKEYLRWDDKHWQPLHKGLV